MWRSHSDLGSVQHLRSQDYILVLSFSAFQLSISFAVMMTTNSLYTPFTVFWEPLKVSVLKFWYFQGKNNFKRRYSLFPKVLFFYDSASFHVDIQAVTRRGCVVLLVAVPFCVWESIFWLGRVIFILFGSSPSTKHTCQVLNLSGVPGYLLAAETRRVLSAQEFAWVAKSDRLESLLCKDLHMQNFRLKSILNTPLNCLSTSGLQ